jgi:hypothetical protein
LLPARKRHLANDFSPFPLTTAATAVAAAGVSLPHAWQQRPI